MPAMKDRLYAEQEHHDRQATERAEYFSRHMQEFCFPDSDYLDHETWIRPAFAQLGNLSGKQVLDYGCGHGMASVVMARQGATVTAFDLSEGYLQEARLRAKANQVAIQFVQADAEKLPFAEATFDAVWGCAILHHLDLLVAALELRRILKPGGVAVFCEPWGGNPLLNWGRRWLPYPGKDRTRDERPLLAQDLVPLRQVFPDLQVHGYQFFGMARRLWSRQPQVGGWLDRLDRWCLFRLPVLQKWGRYVVLTLRRG